MIPCLLGIGTLSPKVWPCNDFTWPTLEIPTWPDKTSGIIFVLSTLPCYIRIRCLRRPTRAGHPGR